jgi:ribonucleoside-triphosphate reductase (formate)
MSSNIEVVSIQKRDGSVVDFDKNKIISAITKATKTTSEPISEFTMNSIIDYIIVQILNLSKDKTVSVEDIQDFVEKALMRFGFPETSKSYIIYRYKREAERNRKNLSIAVNDTVNEYLDKSDWRVRANSNQAFSLGSLILHSSAKVIANYWLSNIYPKEAGQAHRNGDVHIHDLDLFAPYCCGYSLRVLLEEGLNGVDEKIESNPPKHLSSATSQMTNFLGILQNEWAGAQAFSSFDTLLAPFVRKYREEVEQYGGDTDKLVYDYVYQNIQAFVFNSNMPSRWGSQCPFSNITLDWVCPDDMKDQRLKLGGKPYKYTFGELQNEMDIINKVYIEVMTAGDSKGRTFTFPIPTYNITKDFDWNDPKVLPLFEMTAKYGTPYFQNFINSDLNPGDVRSMCCRLQLNLNELRKKGGGLFGSGEQTGSIGVVTLAMARIGYNYKGDKEGFFKQVEYLMEVAKQSLELKRKELTKWLERGLFPYTKRYVGSFRSHFSTIGVNGINEAIRNFTNDKEDITTEFGQDFAREILNHMRNKLVDFQEETGNLYNLEATPAEGATYRFAKEDQKCFPEIIQAGTPEAPYYTNSSQLPVGFTDDVFEALDLQDDLQTLYTGGTTNHVYMSERVSSAESCRDLVMKILSNYRLPYLTITPTFSICPTHGYLCGEHETCPDCECKCEVWTRAMGYHRPVSNFNIGKQSEHKERVHFKE